MARDTMSISVLGKGRLRGFSIVVGGTASGRERGCDRFDGQWRNGGGAGHRTACFSDEPGTRTAARFSLQRWLLAPVAERDDGSALEPGGDYQERVWACQIKFPFARSLGNARSRRDESHKNTQNGRRIHLAGHSDLRLLELKLEVVPE